MKSKLLVVVTLLAVATSSFAEDTGPDQSSAWPSTLTRAEVRAELAMWKRAGMDLHHIEHIDYYSADYQRRAATFARLMSGPEYLAEVQRIGGRATRTANADRTATGN